ncbi:MULTISPECIES: hypothetical protein [Bacteria]|uniref:Uncharacterized protein n=1 Tax=Providencia huashanensis TaxID=3037798 RepID=A0AA42FLJ4_9GAMM|nr:MULTISPECIES: hypothetical protein [unclassified Providencia]MDG4698863.1 hypothetical protein [Providencia sp. CRE-3FA-0001]
MGRFKLGDKVKVIKDLLGSKLEGYECKVINIDNDYELNIGVSFHDGSETFFSQNELELIQL